MNGPIDLSGAWHSLSGPYLDTLGPLVPVMNLLGAILVASGLVVGLFQRGYSGSSGGKLWIASAGLLLAGPGLFIPLLLSLTDIVFNGLYSAVGAQPEEPSSAPSEEPTAATPTPDPSPVSDGGGDGGLLGGWGPLGMALIVLAVVGLVYASVALAEGFSDGPRRPSEKTPREIKREERSKQRIAMVEAQKELDERWSEAKIAHDRAFKRWSKYETDLGEILSRPMMRDLSDPAVAEVVRAMGRADTLRTEKAPRLSPGQTIDDVSGYLLAVHDFSTSLTAAERRADSPVDGYEKFSKKEISQISSAQLLLNQALDPNLDQNSRQMAYERVVKIVKGLQQVSVPEDAFAKFQVERGFTPAGLLER